MTGEATDLPVRCVEMVIIALSQNECNNTLLGAWMQARLCVIVGSFMCKDALFKYSELREFTVGDMNEENTVCSYTPGLSFTVTQSMKERRVTFTNRDDKLTGALIVLVSSTH